MSSAKRVRAYRLRKKTQKKVKIDETFEFLCTNNEVFSTRLPENQCKSDSDSGDDCESEAENKLESETENMTSDGDESVCWNTVELDCKEPTEDSDSNVDSDDNGLTYADDSEEKPSSNEEPEVNELRTWAIESGIPKKHLDKLLSILKKRLLPDIPACSKTFLFTTSAKYNIETMLDSTGSLGEFCYLGIAKGLQACVNPELHPDNILKLDFNIDGVKIKKSSSKTMWPILCRVFYERLPITYKPFSVSIFYGNGKYADGNKFFEDFVSELNALYKSGIFIRHVHFSIEIRSFICDTPARSQVKSIKGHMSFNGCERCDTTAYRVDHTTVYKNLGQRRTSEDFRAFTDLEHHTKASPLLAIEPAIDLVNQFVLDSMHLLYLGLMLRLFENWMAGEKDVKLSAQQKTELDRRMVMLKKDIPKEFNRKIRPPSDYSNYKAAEHRFFALYCGPIVLKKILKQDLYEHFLLFHVSCRLLSSKEAPRFTTISRDYLNRFVDKSSSYYSDKFVTLNVHNLCHLPDDVQNFQCNLNDISAFPFESELGKIKKVLLSPHNTLAQYCRRIHEEREILNQVPTVPEDMSILKKNKKGAVLQLMYKQQYFSLKHPDNCAILNDGSIIKIINIMEINQKINLEVVKYKIVKSIYSTPCDSSLLEMYEIGSVEMSANSRIVPVDEIRNKIVNLNINFSPNDECRSFAIPLLH